MSSASGLVLAGDWLHCVADDEHHLATLPWHGGDTAGVLQLQVLGSSAKGAESTVALKPVPLSFTSHDVVRGSQPLPDGFRPREAKVQVLDRPAGAALGMRVMLVK